MESNHLCRNILILIRLRRILEKFNGDLIVLNIRYICIVKNETLYSIYDERPSMKVSVTYFWMQACIAPMWFITSQLAR